MALCAICIDEKAKEINRAILSGNQPPKAVAVRFGFKVWQVKDHRRKHLPWNPKRAPAVSVAEQMEDLKLELRRLQVLAECGENVTGPLAVLRQRQSLVEHWARILWLGCGTKTGKTFGLVGWLISGMLDGEATCFCGPWYHRSRAAFDLAKDLLQPFVVSRHVKINEARLQLSSVRGGYTDFTSADNPNALFGGNYHRLVIDEASRCPTEIYPAGLTTISGTNGRVRLAFNLELGSRNWAIRNLLRVQALGAEEQKRTSEAFLTFPSGGDGLVSPELIAMLRTQMPAPLWRALYLGEIPTSDCSLFRNLDKAFVGRELEAPEL